MEGTSTALARGLIEAALAYLGSTREVMVEARASATAMIEPSELDGFPSGREAKVEAYRMVADLLPVTFEADLAELEHFISTLTDVERKLPEFRDREIDRLETEVARRDARIEALEADVRQANERAEIWAERAYNQANERPALEYRPAVGSSYFMTNPVTSYVTTPSLGEGGGDVISISTARSGKSSFDFGKYGIDTSKLLITTNYDKVLGNALAPYKIGFSTGLAEAVPPTDGSDDSETS